MRICHFITTLARGGAENQLLRLIPTLEEEGHYQSVCYIGQDHHMRDEFEETGIEVTCFNGTSKKDFFLIVQRLKKYLKKDEFDVLHNHQVHTGVIGRIAGIQTGVERIITTHQNVCTDYDFPTRSAELSTRPLDDVTVGVSDGVTESFNNSTLDKVINQGCNWRMIPNTINVQEFRKKLEDVDPTLVYDDWNIDRDRTIYLNVGRYAEQKNQKRILQAMESAIAERSDLHLLMVGWGPLEEELKHLIDRYEIEDHVTLTGEVTDIHPLYAAADVFVLPSLYEGLSIASVEALAAGLPLIGSDVPGTNEVVVEGRNGYLINPEDTIGLTNAILNLMEGSVRDQMGKESLELARSKYSIERAKECYLKAYHIPSR